MPPWGTPTPSGSARDLGTSCRTPGRTKSFSQKAHTWWSAADIFRRNQEETVALSRVFALPSAVSLSGGTIGVQQWCSSDG
jgi:hypothetical protein